MYVTILTINTGYFGFKIHSIKGIDFNLYLLFLAINYQNSAFFLTFLSFIYGFINNSLY